MSSPNTSSGILSSPTSRPDPTTTTSTPTTSSTSTSTTTTHGATTTPSTSLSSTTSTTTTTGTTQSSSTTETSVSQLTSAQVVTSGSTIETITSVIVSGPTATSQSSSSPSSNNSFFHNTGAVAGVFTVVGLIVAGLVIALVINAVRRRRAEKFDRDVAEAAAEAAASSRSPFDDYGGNGGGGGGGGGGGYGYSDNSHGTYQLPPVAQNDAYGMSEMSQYDPYAAGTAALAASAVGRSRSRKESEPGAPGIAGVGAGSLGREPSKRAPYHAFAGPGPQPHELQPSNGTFRSRRSNQDVLEAAGLAAGVGAAAVAANNNFGSGPNAAYVTRSPSDTHNTLDGRKFGSMSSGGHHPPTLQPGYPVDSYYPSRNDTISPDPFATYPPITTSTTPAPSNPLPNPHDATVPSPSIQGHQSEHNEDLGESGSPTALRSDEQRMSYQDDTDYSQGHRVLRVANE